MKRIQLVFILSLLVLSLILANSGVPSFLPLAPQTWYVDDDGPADFQTIQEAINNANSGDTIFVFNGTYSEHVVINKSISLFGQNQTTTIVDGMGNGTVVTVIADNVTINDFTIRNSGERYVYGEPAIWCGIMVGGYEMPVNYTSISNNTLKDNYIGVFLYYALNGTLRANNIENNTSGVWLISYGANVVNNTVSHNDRGLVTQGLVWSNVSHNAIESNEGVGMHLDSCFSSVLDGNRVERNGWGIDVAESADLTLKRNDLADNQHGFGIFGNSLTSYMHNIDSSNTVNGKPVYYLANKQNFTVDSSTFPDVGFLGIVNCTKINIENLSVTGNSQGLLLAGVIDSSISAVNTSSNKFGIHLAFSHNNTLTGVTIANSLNYSIYLEGAHNNTLYHNNFVNNTDQTLFSASAPSYDNRWDNGYAIGGNYWNDYSGADLQRGPHQNETGSDGLGDVAYLLDGSNQDQYPLMGPSDSSTMKGENVTIFPAFEVGLIFRNVTTAGSSNVNSIEVGPDPPSTFKISQYYNIETTAVHSDKMLIRMVYDDADITPEEETSLQLMQWDNVTSEWVNVTIYKDTQYDIVLGEISHLSIFGVTRGFVLGDADRDLDVDIFDIVLIVGAYGSEEGGPAYNRNCDLDGDGDVDIYDVVTAAGNYGYIW